MKQSDMYSRLLSSRLDRRHMLGGAFALGALGIGSGPALASIATPGNGPDPQQSASGVPLFVNPTADLAMHANSALESWYVNAAFQSRGKQLGFLWHQGITAQGSMSEFLLMNGTDGVWRPHLVSEPNSAGVGASMAECHVYSSLGEFKGDRSELRLKLRVGQDAVDVVLTPSQEELYNGTTGLLHLLGSDSYEYAFPNTVANGSLTINGEVFPVESASTWIDRQWGKAEAATPEVLAQKAEEINQSHWTWLGLAFGPGEKSAISFWDVMQPQGRQTFLTYRRSDGVQMNVAARVEYDRIWTSKDTGQRYPDVARITAPLIDLDITLTSILAQPEFVYQPGEGHSGCEGLCIATGHVGATRINKPTIFEMIGGLGSV
jgi:predicted secreted hydrolase